MQTAERIETTLAGALDPEHLDIVNESGNHNVPRDSETHFKVTVVAPEFEGMSRVQRHRRINRLLADELSAGVHALALHAYTRDEWQGRFGEAPMSPPCLGGGRG